jgi:hypothetical protein
MAVVIAIHEIEDVAGFWLAVRCSLPPSPAARLDAFYPLVNGVRAVSVWHGPSADAVGDLVDSHLEGFSTNEFYEVDRERAVPNLGAADQT